MHYPHVTPKASWPTPAGLTPEEAVRQAQVSAAHELEGFARAILRGEQFTGVQLSQRRVVVDQAERAWDIASVWRAAPRDAEVQALVDRAVGCLRQCLAQGVVVLEWDRPGYDDVTRAYRELLPFASDPDVTPVELPWEPEFKGEPVLPTKRAPPVPPRTLFGEVRAGAVRGIVKGAIAIGFALLVASLLRGMRTRPARVPAPPRRSCAEERAWLRAELARSDAGGLADDPAVRAEALARFDRNDVEGAHAVLVASKRDGPQLLAVQVFVYATECAPRAPATGP